MSRLTQRRPRLTQQRTRAFVPLKECIILAAQPVMAISGPAEVPRGEATSITLTFDNQPDARPGDRTGFARDVDLVLPQNGADGDDLVT